MSGPAGLAFDSAGNLFVGNVTSGVIDEFTPGGAGSVFATGITDPQGLAFDTAGNLYVAGFTGGLIDKFTPGGASSLYANVGAGGPTSIAFASSSSVPEPSTWALFAAAGGVALVFNRRAKLRKSR